MSTVAFLPFFSMSPHPGTIRPGRTDGDASEWESSSERLFISFLSHSLIHMHSGMCTRAQSHTAEIKTNTQIQACTLKYTSEMYMRVCTHSGTQESIQRTENTGLTFNINCRKTRLLQEATPELWKCGHIENVELKWKKKTKNTKAGLTVDIHKDEDTDFQYWRKHGFTWQMSPLFCQDICVFLTLFITYEWSVYFEVIIKKTSHSFVTTAGL